MSWNTTNGKINMASRRRSAASGARAQNPRASSRARHNSPSGVGASSNSVSAGAGGSSSAQTSVVEEDSRTHPGTIAGLMAQGPPPRADGDEDPEPPTDGSEKNRILLRVLEKLAAIHATQQEMNLRQKILHADEVSANSLGSAQKVQY